MVGGGARLFCLKTLGCLYRIPINYQVANAYGAALAEISGKVDEIVSLEAREETVHRIKEQAIAKAVAKGACPERVRVIDLQLIPYHYMPGNKARVIATASGPNRHLFE